MSPETLMAARQLAKVMQPALADDQIDALWADAMARNEAESDNNERSYQTVQTFLKLVKQA